ncbi:MAG: Ppx/GppA family phosphatase, partial [Alphaproteobacteria bacterium]
RVQMLGTSGTVTTFGGIYLGLPRYDRSRVDGLVIDFDSIAAIGARRRRPRPAPRRRPQPANGRR